MPDFLFQMTSLKLFIFLSSIAIISSMITILLIRRFVPAKIQYKDNAVIGNISALISIIYGVLTSLIALYLINNISFTAEAVQNEASAVANIYRESKWVSEPSRSKIHDYVKQYLHNDIENDWPKMMVGESINNNGAIIINQLSNELNQYYQHNKDDMMIVREMVDDTKQLYNAREQRIRVASSQLNTETYVVILIGTVLTVVMSCLFGMNIYLHLFTVSATALMTASMFFLIISLDRPFLGDFVVDTSGFQSVLKLIENTENNHLPF